LIPSFPRYISPHGRREEVGDRRKRVPWLPCHQAARRPRRRRAGADPPDQPTKAIEDLDVEYHYGDIFDDAAVRTAMAGCDDVFYCVVDTRAWLRDPTPLYRTNVDGLRHVLDAAVDADLRRFVFTSTIGTIGIPAERRPATEEDEFNWADVGGAYVVSRVEAENLVMRTTGSRRRTGSSSRWPPPENCPSTSRIGWAKWWASRTPRPPCSSRREEGRNGERYIVSERFMGVGELYETAADASEVKPPRFGIRCGPCT
jgi:dihydroflavonol-4-reductase